MVDSHVLVVEDDDVVSDYLRLCLMLMGLNVVDTCCYGEEAVEKARSLQPDLILMDIKLRGEMNGLEAVEMIHAFSDIPIIYLTAYGDDDILQSAKVTNPYGYLLKPFRESELKTVIEIALSRHQMEKELRERETSYRVLAESLPGIVTRTFLDESKKMIFFNDMLEKMTGFKEEELHAGAFYRIESLLVLEDKPIVRDALSKAICEYGTYEVEYRIRHKNGSIKYFFERGRARRPLEGGSSFIDSVIFDITERKSSEEKLEMAYLKLMERQNFIESILANIQSGIIVTDLDFHIMLINPSGERILGVSREDVTGKDLEIVCATFAKALKEDGEIDEIYCTSCGREHVIGFKIFDMKNNDDLISGHIVSFADLTEIIKIRKEIKLKERLATMGEFVARVAHEIRNPLFGMTAICQIFSMELNLNDEHKKLMNSMMKEAWRLKQIVEELLDCSRELKIVKSKNTLEKIINDSLFENEIFLVEKGVSIEKIFPTENIPVDVDQGKIKQVVINLLKNAVEASKKQGVISIVVEKIDGLARFSISDSGEGIAETAMDKIFDVFYTTKRHGTGLGLAISKNIIVAHGGSIYAQNRSEGGATFVFTLPVSC